MVLSSEMQRLQNRWQANTGWPRRLEWLEIHGIRGWTGQRVDLGFPIMAIVGENGSGKSTVLQAAAAAYRAANKRDDRYASDFFPDTPFERISEAQIKYSYREGQNSNQRSVRKPTDRWRGNPERPERKVEYIDLSRIQPVGARTGYAKMLKAGVVEHEHQEFEAARLARLSGIMGRIYETAGMSVTNADAVRKIPTMTRGGERYSGFHQGVGEIAAAELLAADYSRYSLVLIDEIETSLHPRAQRRLIRDLAQVARESELQILLTTHSPFILAELPPEGRLYLMEGVAGKTIVTGVSPEFAMTKMDEERHPECDVYVEDKRAATLVTEVLAREDRDSLARVHIIPYGSASVGQALGMMVSQSRFPRPSVVFLDGDQGQRVGCTTLPGNVAPEVLVFDELAAINWDGVATRIARGNAETIDALNAARAGNNHHHWLTTAADSLIIGTDQLWQAMCVSWSTTCLTLDIATGIAQPVKDALDRVGAYVPAAP